MLVNFLCSYKPWYLEECSSTLATTYSSGTPGLDRSVATVDMDGNLRPDHICTVEHTGEKGAEMSFREFNSGYIDVRCESCMSLFIS